MEINDFGEKIGGARKDLASKKKFGITADDIKEWTDEERLQLVTKDLAFPKPNYKKLYDDGKGMDRNVLFYIKTVRDNIPTRPYIPYSAQKDIDRIKAIQNDYLDTVNNLYKLTMNLRTLEDCYKFPAKILSDSFVDSSSIVKNQKFINKIRLDSDYYTRRFARDLCKKQFLFSDDEKILTNYAILSTADYKISLDTDKRLMLENGYSKRWINLSKPEFQDINKWKDNTYFVVDRGHSVIAINLDSVEEANKKILELNKTNTAEKEKPSQSRKHSLKPPQLENLKPASEDYRHGKNIEGQDILDTFSIRGGEFGNWNNQNDRQENMNLAYDAFKDLAKALDISDKDIGLGGKLAIAWGSRGRGSALAHYEPMANVINLTKMRGAGSLAHEWGHALDSYICKKEFGDKTSSVFATDYYKKDNPLRPVMNAIKYKEVNRDGLNVQTESQFYIDAIKADAYISRSGNQSGCYWQSDVELFARAFASYVHDKLPPDTSDYLIAHSELKRGSIHLSPQGEERERINEAFDNLIEELKEKEILHQRDVEPEIELQQPTEVEKVCESVIKDIDRQNLVASLQVGDIVFLENSVVYDFDKKDGNPVLKVMPDEYCKIIEIDDNHIKYQGYSNPDLIGTKNEREITCDIDDWKNEMLGRNIKMIKQKECTVASKETNHKKQKEDIER